MSDTDPTAGEAGRRSSTERVAVSVRWAARAIAACALYVGAALLGVALALDGSIVSLFWLPTGIAVAALVCWGVPIVAPLVFTVFALQLWLDSPPWAAAVMALGGVGGPWIASRVLVKRGLDPELGSAADFRSIGYAATLGMLLPATTGMAMLVAGGRMPAESALIAWIVWYAGDTLGVLLAAPLLIAAHSAWRSGTLLRRPDGRPEPAAMIAVALLLAAGVGLTLLTVDPNDASGLAAMFAMQLAAAAAGAWFGVVGAWATLVAVALAVVVPASMGVGPFVRSVPNEGQWVGWLFLLMVTASLVLILSARRRLQGVQSALELRERQLRAMFEQSNAALSVSERGRYVMVNDAFCRMVGYRRDELIGKLGSEITHPDDGHLNAAALRRWVERGRGSGVLFEKRYLHKDGRTVWSRIAISVIESPQAAVPQVVAVKLDITEHKRVEASLRRQREQLSLVFDATGAGIWDHDMLTGRSFFSDSYLRMLGYPPGSSLHSAIRDQSRLHPDDRGRIVQLQRRMLDERVPFDAEYRLARADGGWMCVHGRGFAAWDDTGRPVRHYGTIADISARKAAEAALVDSRARLSAIIDSALDAIVTIDEAGRIVLFNPAAEVLFGRNASDLLGRPILPLMPPRMRADALARLVSIADAPGARSHGGAGHARMPMVHADGTEFSVEAAVSRVTVDAGRLITLVLRDARERERIEAAETARAQAETASQAKSEFLSRMSHELRTPLNAVLGFAQLMEIDGDAPLPAAQRERAHAIRQAGTHLGALIDELLDLTRIESGRMFLERHPIDALAIVRECQRFVSPTAAGSAVTVAPPLQLVRGLHAMGDSTRLRQVLVNLLTNAIKYNRPGGTVRVTLDRDIEGNACIAVEDDGPGIALADQARLFEPFERLGHERGPIEGSGIGLALSRRLVELMGGRIEVDSTPGQGSIFRVRLASAPPGWTSAMADESPDPSASDVARTVPDRV